MSEENEDIPTAPARTGPDESTVQYQWDGDATPSTAVVEAVAATTGRELTALPSLYESVDAEAIDDLFSDPDGTVRLSFEYAGVTVTLYADGGIEVSPP
ncbi:hypothetical protein SY89_03281 [Halolamina pelagica]|uniref:Halobacterial output domain-containing protein n=1 Tax=Halolamina pelagica TaxID=699431 RepID=A0A0P7G798_9EURY|nr:HalOD1 output domain-containing protein [Halolamina pelagica]KPN29047.1 hypothetical protein SY89_03281 [Halolamina pelagica]